jgi:conjugative transfer signal peptidase TraF
MSPRRFTLLTMLIGAAMIAAPIVTDHAPRLIWNVSASVPIGLYAVAHATMVDVGDLVAVLPPDDLATFLEARGYLPRGVPLIKRVLALPGTEVCRRGAGVIAYDYAYGEAQARDRVGRDLPQWQGCHVIAEGEIFLMSWDASDSLDGRYFGPLPRSAVIARVTPLFTDEYGDGRFRWRFTDPALEP